MRAIHRRVVGRSALWAFALVMPAVALAGPDDRPEAAPAARLSVSCDGESCALSLVGGPAFHATTNQVCNDRLVEVPGAPSLLILWDEVLADGQTVRFYAISLDGQSVARVRQTSYVLKLRHGDFDPLVAVPPANAGLAAGAGCNLSIVQFDTQPLEVFRTTIRDLGGTVYHFLANHAHIVKMSPPVRDAVAQYPNVRGVGPYQIGRAHH